MPASNIDAQAQGGKVLRRGKVGYGWDGNHKNQLAGFSPAARPASWKRRRRLTSYLLPASLHDGLPYGFSCRLCRVRAHPASSWKIILLDNLIYLLTQAFCRLLYCQYKSAGSLHIGVVPASKALGALVQEKRVKRRTKRQRPLFFP